MHWDAQVASSAGREAFRMLHHMRPQPASASHMCAGNSLYIQRCEVQPFTLTLHYRPHRVDLAALSRHVPRAVGVGVAAAGCRGRCMFARWIRVQGRLVKVAACS